MTTRLNISVPDELGMALAAIKSKVNVSKVCQAALIEAISELQDEEENERMKEAIREELLRIHDENGELTPPMVVEEARNDESPLHACFEWDDQKAGHSFRLWQARSLIRTVTFVVEKKGQAEHVFYHTRNEDGQPKYHTKEILIQHQDLRERAIAFAKERLGGSKRALAELTAIAPKEERFRRAERHVDEAVAAMS